MSEKLLWCWGERELLRGWFSIRRNARGGADAIQNSDFERFGSGTNGKRGRLGGSTRKHEIRHYESDGRLAVRKVRHRNANRLTEGRGWPFASRRSVRNRNTRRSKSEWIPLIRRKCGSRQFFDYGGDRLRRFGNERGLSGFTRRGPRTALVSRRA